MVNATEVSVCFNGARDGTRLYKHASEYDSIKINATAMDAGMNADTQIKDTVVADAAGNYSDMNLSDLLQEATKNSDSEMSNHLFKRVADMAKTMQNSNSEEEKHRNQITELTQAKDELTLKMSQSEMTNKKKAEECVAVMNALMAEYVPGAHSTIPVGSTDDNATFRDIAYSVPILASALHGRRALNQATADARVSARNDALAEVRAMEASMKNRMPSVWDDKEIHVKASSRAHARDEDEPAAKRASPIFHGLSEGQRAALADIGSYQDTGDRQSVEPGMMPRGYKGMAQDSLRLS